MSGMMEGLGGAVGGAGGGGGGGFMQGLGALSGALGQFQQISAQSQAADAQAAAYSANARIAQMNAASALKAGEQSKERRERLAKANLAGVATSYLNSGVSLAGSPLAVLGDRAAEEALAAEDLLYDAKVQANQFNNEAKLQQFHASQASSKSSQIFSQGLTRTGMSLLGSLSKIQ